MTDKEKEKSLPEWLPSFAKEVYQESPYGVTLPPFNNPIEDIFTLAIRPTGLKLNCIQALFTAPYMESVYHHIEAFHPSPSEGKQILTNCIIYPYRYIREHMYTDDEYEESLNKAIHKRSIELYDLLLLSGGRHAELQQSLLGLLRRTTSTSILRIPELDWSEGFAKHKPVMGHPLLNGQSTEQLDASFEWTKFIEKSLAELDDLSRSYERSFEITRTGNRETPRPNGYIFFEPRHWRAICTALFDSPKGVNQSSDDYQNKTIGNVVRRHRHNSPLYISQ